MVKKFKENLIGERIILKQNKANLKNSRIMFETVNENREYLAKWLDWVPLTLKIEDSLKFLLEVEKDYNLGNKIDFGIFLGEKYIGNLGVFNMEKENSSAEIGYWLSQRFTKKGYMTEAVKIIEKELFETHKLNRLQIQCDELNTASENVAIKCGYKFEGLLRENFYIKKENSFRNTKIYSKLKFEYNQNL